MCIKTRSFFLVYYLTKLLSELTMSVYLPDYSSRIQLVYYVTNGLSLQYCVALARSNALHIILTEIHKYLYILYTINVNNEFVDCSYNIRIIREDCVRVANQPMRARRWDGPISLLRIFSTCYSLHFFHLLHNRIYVLYYIIYVYCVSLSTSVSQTHVLHLHNLLQYYYVCIMLLYCIYIQHNREILTL